MLARVPASSANLGPGFDVLAVALERYVEVTVDEAEKFSITTSGAGAGRFDGEDHLAARVAAGVLGHYRFALNVHSTIPVSRGLGSSAALALAAAAAAGAVNPLAVAVDVDGHAENAAASWRGGLVASSRDPDGSIVVRDLVLDDVWRFVVVIPDIELSTAEARGVLPASVPFADAVSNLRALAELISGLADHRVFRAAAMDDALHQPYRASLLPFATPLLAALREGGAAGSCWSGAGSTMLGLATVAHAEAVAHAARDFCEREGIAGSVDVLRADRTGLVVR